MIWQLQLKMGNYTINHVYGFNEYNGFYRMYVRVRYSDRDYVNLSIYPEKFELKSSG